MPPSDMFTKNIQSHIDEAQANRRRYELMLTNPDDVSWGLVFLFYSALHLIQAYAKYYTPDDIPKDHKDRQYYVAYYFDADIAAHYEKLYTVSRQVRYSLSQYELAQVREVHDNVYAKVRRYFRDQNIAWATPNSSNPATNPTTGG